MKIKIPCQLFISVAFWMALCGGAPQSWAAPATNTYEVLYSFCSESNCMDGANPAAGLIRDAAGNLYGTTLGGGNSNCTILYEDGSDCGTMFKLDNTGHYAVLYSFCSESNCADGAGPEAGLIQDAAGNLYGTTFGGGTSYSNYNCPDADGIANGCGTVFKLDNTGHYTVLYNFCSDPGCTDGANPEAGLIQDAAGNLYGTTSQGGAVLSSGTVFKVDTTGHETVLYNFCSLSGCTDGQYPMAGLIRDAAGNLYGTTYFAGNSSESGTVFKLDTTGHLTVLYSFCSEAGCTDGASPQAGLIQDAAGNLYGTTVGGGIASSDSTCNGGGYGCGTVFKLDNTDHFTVLHTFCSDSGCADGGLPYAGLIQDAAGNLYGTTSFGGTTGWGTVFKVDTTRNETVLYSFCPEPNLGCIDGQAPVAGLIQDAAGNLYGTAQSGGANGGGTVFELPTGGVPSVSLSTNSVSFANQPVGTTSAAATVTVTNNGSANLTISTVTIGGTNASDFAKSADTCTGATVTPNSTCTVSVTFTPSATGSLSASLNFTDNASNSPQTVSLTGGVATAPVASVSASSLTFGNQSVGTTSALQPVTLSNTGSAALTITNITTSANFGQTNTCAGSVAASGSCTINVTFSPTATGPLTGTITVTDNSNGVVGSTQTVTLSGTGTGTAPVAGVSPLTLTFGNQNMGTTSTSQPVTLSNSGSGALTITSIAASANFGETNNCAGSVAASGSCTINVTFTPTAAGSLTGTLTITDNNNGAAGSTQSVALSGSGQDFTLTASSGSSTSATVAPGSPATYTLSVAGVAGLSGTVSFTCTGAPSEATCTVSPNPATIGSSATNVTVTVTTTAASVSMPRSRPLPPVPPLSPGLRGLLMLALVLTAIAWAIVRRNQPGVSRWQTAIVLFAAGLLLTMALAGCGGGGGGGGGTPPNSGTPAGTYPLTVTGTAGSGSSALSHSVTLTLTVN